MAEEPTLLEKPAGEVVTDLPTQDTQLVTKSPSTENVSNKKENIYPKGYNPCVYVDSIATAFDAKPLEWAPDKNQLSKTEIFTIPSLSQDVVVFVSSEGQESYFKTLPPGMFDALSQDNLDENKNELGSDKITILQKIDSTEAEEIKKQGGAIVTDTEARAVAEKFGEVTPDKIRTKRDIDNALSVKAAWSRIKELNSKVADYSRNRWVVSEDTGDLPDDIYEWDPEKGKKAISLPLPGDALADVVIKVPQEEGSKYYQYSVIPPEKGNEGNNMGFLNEIGDFENNKLKRGSIVVEPELVRQTFDNYGTVTKDTLRWQTRDLAEAAYSTQADRDLAELKKNEQDKQRNTVDKLIGKIKNL